MRALIDLGGRRFGRLNVVPGSVELRRITGKSTSWLCKCDCGNTTRVQRSYLLSGSTQSCGCFRDECSSVRNRIHGHTVKVPTGTYRSWQGMLSRCQNPRNEHFRDYGGRGITVCDRWKSFPKFLSDMGDKPPRLTLHRIDNNGNYTPGNCKWATGKEQASNRRPPAPRKFLTIDGVKKSLVEWSAASGLSYLTIYHRAARGIAPRKILSL